MLRLASDADVRGDVVRGLRRRQPAVDLVRVQDALPDGAPDSEVLAWAVAAGRVLITNDRNTMVDCVREFTATGPAVPGLIVTTIQQSVGSTIDDIHLIAEFMSEEEVRTRVVIFLPLRD
ncbi:MAG: DUF5615 family PIN-like protein [Planctomycetaceae bacterium]|nr:DUF5615 family PIN-like protein [Planctomycetaceae bacterium]